MYSAIQPTECNSSFTAEIITLTLNLLRTTIVAPPSNASKWHMGFNSAFKGLIVFYSTTLSIVVAQNTQCRMIKYTNM